MKIVIVAAGLASRLQPLTNHIPKILVNIGKQTGLVEMVNYWKGYSNDFTIIVHSKFETLVREYFDMYFANSDLHLNIETIDVALGTAHTISNTVDLAKYHGESILFTWCDVIPSELIDTWAFEQDVCVFTNRNQKNRYAFTHKKLVQVNDMSGDVVGMYFIKNYDGYKFEQGQDFADCLDQFGMMTSYQLDNMIDFGDMEKLNEVLDQSDEAREFNTLVFHENMVEKTALNAQGRSLIAREVNWYKNLEALDPLHSVVAPKVFPSIDGNSFMMSRVDGQSIYKMFSNMTAEAQTSTVSKVIGALENLHSLEQYRPNKNQICDDIKIEAYTKIKARCAEIQGVIASFGNVYTVNGTRIYDFEYVLKTMHEYIENAYVNTLSAHHEYCLIHGDAQFSNTMLNNNGDVVFIDPRGYFGNTIGAGLKEYDFAKLLYSLSGYDTFNYSRDFHILNINHNSIEFDIPKLDVKFDYDIHFSTIEQAWLVIIWLGLAGYIKNNPVKSLAAYYHGLDLGTKFINEYVHREES